MDDEWRFEIPGPSPSVNTTYKVITIAGRGRLAKHPEVATWQDTVAWLVKAARPRGWEPARRTVIEIRWFTPRPKDADNGIKALLDAIAVGLGCDDKGFLPRVIVNEVDKASPRTEVRIRNE